MISMPLGILIVLASLIFAFDSKSLHLYQNGHAVLIVILGSVGIGCLSIPMSQLKNLWKSVQGLWKNPVTFSEVESEIRAIAADPSRMHTSKHELIQYACELMNQGVDPDLFTALISQKNRDMDQRMLESIQSLKNMAKYPPALGMVGTVMGMISLFSAMDANKANIGLHLSMAMTATFFGLILSNFAISPLADRLQVLHASSKRLNQSIYELLLLINRGEPDTFIADELKGRLDAA